MWWVVLVDDASAYTLVGSYSRDVGWIERYTLSREMVEQKSFYYFVIDTQRQTLVVFLACFVLHYKSAQWLKWERPAKWWYPRRMAIREVTVRAEHSIVVTLEAWRSWRIYFLLEEWDETIHDEGRERRENNHCVHWLFRLKSLCPLELQVHDVLLITKHDFCFKFSGRYLFLRFRLIAENSETFKEEAIPLFFYWCQKQERNIVGSTSKEEHGTWVRSEIKVKSECFHHE